METARGTTRTSRRPGALVAAALLALLALLAGGCSASSGGDGATSTEGGGATAEQAQDAGGESLGSAVDAAGTAADAAAAAREVITTGSATLVAEDPLDAASRIATLAEKAGGRVEVRDEHRASGTVPASARLTLRLPADAVNRTLDALRELGDLADVSLFKEDVTATGRDLDARIGALETSTARLEELMAHAGSVADLLRVEQELATRQGELDALRAQRADLSDRVAMSSLEVHVVADDDAAAALADPPTGFRGGLEAGWDALTAFGRAVAVAFGAVLPWLVPAGVVVAVWRIIVVLVRRRRGARPGVVDAPSTATPADA